MKKNSWKISKTYDGISTLAGWEITLNGIPVAEFYGVPYQWVQKTLKLWKTLSFPSSWFSSD